MTKKNLLVLLAGVFLLAVIAVGGYFYFLQPLTKELENKQAELEMANQQLTILDNQLANITEETAQSTMKLQQKIPVKRSVEQMMLAIEKAETISDVYIRSISMGGSGSDETVEQENNQTVENESSKETEGEDTTPTTVLDEEAEKQVLVLPSGIKKTPFLITGEAKNYHELQRFIDSMQGLQRKVTLEQLSFTGTEEIVDASNPPKNINFSLSIAAFYFPKLEELRNELPPIDTPEISNKKNPFNELPPLQ